MNLEPLLAGLAKTHKSELSALNAIVKMLAVQQAVNSTVQYST